MKEKFIKWLKAAAVRSLKTMAQTALGIVTVGAAMADINWIAVGSTALVAGIYSVLMSIAGLPELKGESADV